MDVAMVSPFFMMMSLMTSGQHFGFVHDCARLFHDIRAITSLPLHQRVAGVFNGCLCHGHQGAKDTRRQFSAPTSINLSRLFLLQLQFLK
jgi:hypothetical protein